jgi:hypothetical protein
MQVLEIAAKHKRTPAQVCLRWAIQSGTCFLVLNSQRAQTFLLGIATIPKSVTASRIVENRFVDSFFVPPIVYSRVSFSKLFDWTLEPADLEELARLDKGQRCVRPVWFDFQEDDKILKTFSS